jgi:hypothetical protein
MRVTWSRVAVVVVTAALVAGAPSRLFAQQKVAAGVNGNVNNVVGPNTAVPGANGVIAAGGRYVDNNGTIEDYRVSAASPGDAAANAAETTAMQTVMDTVEKLRGKAGDAVTKAMKDVVASIDKNIVTMKNTTFDLNAKGQGTPLNATASVFDNKSQGRVVATGNQQVAAPNGRGLLLGASIRSPSNAPLPANATYAGFVANRDPLAVQWSSSIHQVSFNLDGLQLIANSDGVSTFGASAGLSGGFLNGTLDLTTPESSATQLFSLTLGVTGAPGSPTSTSVDFGYFMDPNVSPSQYSISDSDGNTTLAAVQADLATQFALARTDLTTGDTYYGFNPGYSITLGIPTDPNSSTDSVLFLDDFGAATAAVPEPTSILLLGSGLLLAVLYRSRARRTPPANAEGGPIISTPPRAPRR